MILNHIFLLPKCTFPESLNTNIPRTRRGKVFQIHQKRKMTPLADVFSLKWPQNTPISQYVVVKNEEINLNRIFLTEIDLPRKYQDQHSAAQEKKSV